MLLIEFRFPGGRFHATPWGRNVNEGIAEWPPSPYRIVRALVDVCKRRRPDWSDERLEKVLLAVSNPPSYVLPKATATHTRSYLSSNAKDPSSKQKILDAFVVLDKHARLVAGYETDASLQTIEDLRDLLGELNYLGRSESWVKAEILSPEQTPEFNCQPVHGESPDIGSEIVTVACLRKPKEYAALPKKPMMKKKGKKDSDEALSWLQAISLSTKELLNEGWSGPPAMKPLRYFRPSDTFQGESGLKPQFKPEYRAAKYVLHSPVLPLLTDAVAFSEIVRLKLMGTHKKIMGDDKTAVSPAFSGKSPNGGPAQGHKHAYFLPIDEDGDGRIDHLIVTAADPFTTDEIKALDGLRSIWQANGRPDVQLILSVLSKETPGRSSTTWASATPFVTNRHYRKTRGKHLDWLASEIRRECRNHGLPEPEEIDWIAQTPTKGHALRWAEFKRSRKKENTPKPGFGCILRFAEPVHGPFAIGSLAHFGLGVFMPHKEK